MMQKTTSKNIIFRGSYEFLIWLTIQLLNAIQNIPKDIYFDLGPSPVALKLIGNC